MPGYYFNLPQITDLTTVQQVALDEPNPIAILVVQVLEKVLCPYGVILVTMWIRVLTINHIQGHAKRVCF